MDKELLEIGIQRILEPYFSVLDGRDNEPANETIIEISKSIMKKINSHIEDLEEKAWKYNVNKYNNMRQFKTGATRDTNQGKISYYGFRHPLCEHSFGKYMLKHQKQADGKLRNANNWWGGWSEDISIDSLIRHAEDLQAIHAGLCVYKVRDNGEETVVLPYPYKEIFKKELPKNWSLVSKEDCYNAIKFNCNAGLLEYLRK